MNDRPLARASKPSCCSRLIPVTLSLVLFLGCGAVAAAPSSEALKLRSEGIAQLENERPTEAEATFRQLAKVAPRDPLAEANLAIALLRQQKYPEALRSIDAALAKAPKRGDLLAIQAEVLKWSGKGDEALEAYKLAAANAPEDLEVVYGLYRHAEILRSPEAEPSMALALRQLGRLRPDNLLIMLQLGAQAIAREDREAATRAYLRVRELLWQAPPIANTALDRVLQALKSDDLSAARVPSLRLENVLKITPMYQQGQRELSQGIQGNPVTRFADEPQPTSFGEGLSLAFRAESLGGGEASAVASGDFDGDAKQDLIWAAGGKLWLRKGSAGGTGSGGPALPGGVSRLTVMDLDNDGNLDVLAHGSSATKLLLGKGDGSFSDGTAALGLSNARGPAAAALDYDIEGDLDLFVGGAKGELFRNNLQGALEAVGGKALAGVPASMHDAVASDLDRDGDLDLLLAHDKGLRWLDNLRQGEFRNRTADGGLAAAGLSRSVVSADLDNDGWPDLVTGGDGLTFWRNRRGRFTSWSPRHSLAAGTAIEAVVAFDADNDGRLDLAVAGPAGVQVLAQRGSGSPSFEAWEIQGAGDRAARSATDLAAVDADGDGDLDLLAAGPGGARLLRNEGGNRNRWLSVRLKGLDTGNSKNNLFGLGATLEIRAGRAYQFREVAGDVTHLGLGTVSPVDVLRVVWTNGVPQNRIAATGNQRIVEEQVLKGSCPFVYAWDGEAMRFVTDLLWGSPLGLPVAEGVYAGADPRELVAIPGARADAAGGYELRITEELWEAAYFDEVRLWVVDHPAGVEVASSLKILPGEVVPEAVLATPEPRPVAAAWDGQGREVTRQVSARDEVYADGYGASPYQGVARPWSFTFDLGPEATRGGGVRLLLDGWIFPADASLNLAVAQRDDYPYQPPRLEVETEAGQWQVLMPSMGHPAGKTKTMVVDTPPLPRGARKLRIRTSLWLSWDRIAWAPLEGGGATAPVLARLRPERAELAYRGFSALVRRAPNAPHGYDYSRVRAESPWLPFPGAYTRYGEVTPLLEAADDRLVILAPGDEIALRFDASGLPPVPPGHHRSVFLESYGWDKDADRNTFGAQGVEPLPFRAMTAYPYPPGERYPETPETRTWRSEWQTRIVSPEAPGSFPEPVASSPLGVSSAGPSGRQVRGEAGEFDGQGSMGEPLGLQ